MSAKPLWTVAEVARALGLSEKFPEAPIDFVTQDSRLVKPGSLFVALSGTPFTLVQAALGLEFEPALGEIHFRNPRSRSASP